MDAEIIAVGTELLLGEILNSDAQFLAGELSRFGINVFYQTVVGDNHDRLMSTIRTALERSDIVITSGGLGPTHDDITKETLAEAMGVQLELHEESLERMKSYFNRIGRYMSPTNVKQAMMPKGCIVLPNNCGTAPGGIVEKDGKAAIFLPGPPREITAMFRESVEPYLRAKAQGILYSKTLRIFGMGESAVEEVLSEFMRSAVNPTIAPYAKTDEVTLRITAKCIDEKEGEALIAPVEQKIREVLGDCVYGIGDDTLFSVVSDELRKRRMTISFAESCTGGMLAAGITDLEGASDIFCEGHVTYSNQAKMKYLGVSEATLSKFGAVSAQTAEEMAKGLRLASGADIALAVTGIAGPGGGSDEKPVGLVYIGISAPDMNWTREFRFHGDRDRIRRRTCMEAMELVRKYLIL